MVDRKARDDDLLRLLREMARRCTRAALALDAQAAALAFDAEVRPQLEAEAQAAWQAGLLARAVAAAAAHQLDVDDQGAGLDAGIIGMCRTTLNLPATNQDLTSALARLETIEQHGGGVGALDAARNAGQSLTEQNGVAPELDAILDQTLAERLQELPFPDEHAAPRARAPAMSDGEVPVPGVDHVDGMHLGAWALGLIQVSRQRLLLTAAAPAHRQLPGMNVLDVAQWEALGLHELVPPRPGIHAR
ncbi:hypothetical protein [Streptomyces sp. NPDC059003]|uniref:hypothetical protein n=1 Tax=Streptomyces sp. NPDC059003 TaxID=3346691 RepID=UPI0036BEE310